MIDNLKLPFSVPSIFLELKSYISTQIYEDLISEYQENTDKGLYQEEFIRRSAGSNFATFPARLCFLLLKFVNNVQKEDLKSIFSSELYVSTTDSPNAVELPTCRSILGAIVCLDVLSHAHQRETLPVWVEDYTKQRILDVSLPELLRKRLEHFIRKI